MLSRRLTWIVLAVWLVVTGWFVLRDLRPRWRSDEPAAFAIAIGDEPRLSIVGVPRPRPVDVTWNVARNEEMRRDAGTANTRTQYNQWTDALEVVGELKLRSTNPRRTGSNWLEVESTFRVDWDGRLLELEAEIRYRREPLLLVNPVLVGRVVGAWLPGLTEHLPEWPFLRERLANLVGALFGGGAVAPGNYVADWPPAFRLPGWQWLHAPVAAVPGLTIGRLVAANGSRRLAPAVSRNLADAPFKLYVDEEKTARCRARARDGHILPRWRVTGEQREEEYKPVALSPRGNALVPFHPPHRLAGLHPGLRWGVPLIDLEAALTLDRSREVRLVTAEVSDGGILDWHGYQHPVFKVSYREGDRELACSWVRQSDGLVLQQDVSFSSDRFHLVRSPDK